MLKAGAVKMNPQEKTTKKLRRRIQVKTARKESKNEVLYGENRGVA